MKNKEKFSKILVTAGACALTVFALGQSFVPVEVKAEQIISFTANGNDTEDDTKEIQMALDKAREVGGGIIQVPAGKYYISKTLTIYSNTTLKLDENAEMIRMADAGQHIMIRSEKPEENSTIGGYNQFSNITITGGTWNGNVQDKTILAPLMYFCHGNNLNLKDFDIKSACSKHMVIIAGASDSVISGVDFSGFVLYEGEKGSEAYNEYYAPEEGSDEVNVELSKRTMEALHLDIISADGASESMAYPCDGTVNKNITVENCTFTDMMSGIGNHFSTDVKVQSTGFVIRNNTFNNMAYTAVNLYNQSNVTVTENTAKNTGELVRAVNSSGTISNNEIECSNSSSEVNLCGVKATNCNEFYITGNSVTGGVHGISLDKVTGKVSNNTILTSGGKNSASSEEKESAEQTIGNGVTIFQNSKVDVEKNTIKDSTNNGIFMENSTGTISENAISEAGKFGVALYNTSANVKQNQITTSESDSILLNNTTAEVSENTLKDAKRHGIYALEKSVVTVKDNMISNAIENGVYLNNATGNLMENKINGAKNGIYVFGSKNTSEKATVLLNNEVTDASGRGIRVDESTYISVNNNIVKNSGEQGIHVYKTSNTEVKNCSVTENKKVSGIYVYDSSAITVQNCVLDENTGNAIAVYNTTDAVLDTNTMNTPTENGILLNNAKGKVTSNKITSPTMRGIWMLNGTDMEVSSNTITKAKSHGIHVNASTGTLNKNTINESGDRGIYVYDSTNSKDKKLVIKNHTVKSSSGYGIEIGGNSTYVSVSWNVISDNKKQGIRVIKGPSDIQLESNQVTKNGQHGICVQESKNVSVNNNFVTDNKTKEITVVENATGTAKDNVVGALLGTYTYDTKNFPISCEDGLVKASTDWYYVTKGVYNTTYTGMAKNAYGWWYVTNGIIDKTYTGMAKNQHGWWYMKRGKLDTKYTGMAKNQYGWFYMTNGKLDTKYTGMAKNDYGWFYMTNGKLDTKYTGMAKNQYGWFYMTNGKLDTKYTGLATNQYGTWYMQNGKLDQKFNGTITFKNKQYKIKNGKVV